MGIRLMPRIRHWKHLTFYKPTRDAHSEHLDTLFTEMVDWNLLATHLPDMLRVVLSIKAGRITPSTILRKLSTYNQKNKLYQAFRELGRVVRTMFLYVSWNTCLKRGITVVAHLCRSQIKRVTERKNSWPMSNGNAIPTLQRSPAHAPG